MTSAPPVPSSTPPGPFGYKLFRIMFGALSLNNMVVWLHVVAAALVMTSMSGAPLMTALVQSAISFPAFLFSGHAGAISDLVDRRRMMLLTQAGMVLSGAALLATSMTGVLGPWMLLLLTFQLGASFAIGTPTWITAAPDVVPAAVRLEAVGLNSVSYNAGRAVGPALAGAIIAFGGVNLVFGATLLFSLIVFMLVWRHYPAAPPSSAAVQSVSGALLAGLRYARHSPILHACFGRTVTFVLGGSALWALLPLVAQRMSGHATTSTYAWMLGSMGTGAVLAGLLLGRLRTFTTLPRLVTGAALVFAGASAVTAADLSPWLVCAALFLAGGAWVTSGATIMAAIQTSLPLWVRGRVLSLQMLVFQGAMAAGSVLWGLVANAAGVPATLLASAAMICAAQWLSGRWPLRLETAAMRWSNSSRSPARTSMRPIANDATCAPMRWWRR